MIFFLENFEVRKMSYVFRMCNIDTHFEPDLILYVDGNSEIVKLLYGRFLNERFLRQLSTSEKGHISDLAKLATFFL